jgi:hypothetical protein
VNWLRRGDRIHIRSGIPCHFGTVTQDQLPHDPVAFFAADVDDPTDIGYGKRTAWRDELALVPSSEKFTAPLAELVRR